jgi:hypothetical protein
MAALLDPTLPGHVPALAKVTRYTAGMLGVCDHLRGENVLYCQGLQMSHTREQGKTQQILGQIQQLAEQTQQIVWLMGQYLEQS